MWQRVQRLFRRNQNENRGGTGNNLAPITGLPTEARIAEESPEILELQRGAQTFTMAMSVLSLNDLKSSPRTPAGHLSSGVAETHSDPDVGRAIFHSETYEQMRDAKSMSTIDKSSSSHNASLPVDTASSAKSQTSLGQDLNPSQLVSSAGSTSLARGQTPAPSSSENFSKNLLDASPQSDLVDSGELVAWNISGGNFLFR